MMILRDTFGRPSMIATVEAPAAELTEYEAEQVEQIARWKAEHPNILSELFRMVAQPVARAVEQVIPDPVFQRAIEVTYRVAQKAADPALVVRQAGVRELRRR